MNDLRSYLAKEILNTISGQFRERFPAQQNGPAKPVSRVYIHDPRYIQPHVRTHTVSVLVY